VGGKRELFKKKKDTVRGKILDRLGKKKTGGVGKSEEKPLGATKNGATRYVIGKTKNYNDFGVKLGCF